MAVYPVVLPDGRTQRKLKAPFWSCVWLLRHFASLGSLLVKEQRVVPIALHERTCGLVGNAACAGVSLPFLVFVLRTCSPACALCSLAFVLLGGRCMVLHDGLSLRFCVSPRLSNALPCVDLLQRFPSFAVLFEGPLLLFRPNFAEVLPGTH